MAATFLDKFVGWFDPRAGLARHFDRVRLQRAYEAASPRDSWKPRRSGASANADHLADASRLRAKARALVQNVPYVRAGLDALVSATIGTGIMPRATGADAAKIDKLFAEWANVCDADGRLDYYGIQAAAYRAMEQDGEVLVRLRPRRPADGLPVPLQLQLLEIDWLDNTRTQAVGQNQIINGIEYDALGAVAAYWLWESHPGDTTLARGLRLQSKRIPAASIIHLYATERPGQGRGFTRLAPVIARVRDLQLYEDAELARKNLETRLGVLYSGDATMLANPAAGDTTASLDSANTGNLGELSSGGITQLPVGSSVTVVEPKFAGGYVDYVKYNLHLIAAGMGVTYEMLTGDMREVNFSSARVRLLDFRRGVTQMQWLTLKPRLLDPIHKAFIDAADLAGKLRGLNYGVDYSTPKWDYVNPQQDVAADIAEISVGLASPSEKLRQRGYDPKVVFAEIKADFDQMQALGIMDTLLIKEKGRISEQAADPNAAADAADAKDTAATNARRLDTLDRSFERIGAQLGDLATQIGVILSRGQAIHVQGGDTHVTLPPTEVTVEPAPVNNEVRVEGTVVNVPAQEAPVVNVTAQAAPAEVRVVNQVQPAAVTVAARSLVTDVERDAQGRITRTTQRER
jgi:lambda family phage portal protein